MQFPATRGYPSPRTNLLKSYACVVGRSEIPGRSELNSLPKGSSRRTALLIGRGCLMVLHRNERLATKAFAEVQDATAGFASPRNAAEYTQNRHHILATMLAERDDEQAVLRQRKALHRNVVAEAEYALRVSQETWIDVDYRERKLMAGHIAEHTIMGLLTRYVHPWMMAVPSLMQHDRYIRGPRGTNYDGVLVETGPYQADNATQRIQSKLGCIGVCAEPCRKLVDRSGYNPDITFVSGHCDLGMHTDDTGEWQSPLTELLVAELYGGASTDDVLTLDRATDNLLLGITMGAELRQGTMPVPGSNG